ncbi:MAG: signal peptidase I [Candidatus Limnocylindrales bacterium]
MNRGEVSPGAGTTTSSEGGGGPLRASPRVVARLRGLALNTALVAVLALLALVDGGIFGTPWYRFVSVEGGSMAPAIGRGDLILVAPAPARVEPGMILVLRVGGQLVTHRVVSVNPDGTFVTRGDANTVDDAWAGQPVSVEGEYLATVPVLGNVLHVGSTSEATFTDEVKALMTITVGFFPTPVAPPTPPECAGMTFSEVIVGTEGDDVIVAGNGGALVFGLGGNDTLSGGNGKDCIVGGDGNDTLVGGNGKDVLLGGEGNDTLHGDGDGDVLEGGNGKDLLNGGDDTDTCYGTSKDVFVGCETFAEAGATPVPAPVDMVLPAPQERPVDPTATPGPTPAPVDPTATPDPTPAPVDPTATPDPTPAPVDPTATPGPTPAPVDPTATPGPTPAPVDPTATPGPTPAPVDPTATPEPTADPTSAPVSTPEPAPEPAPTPAAAT